MVWQRRFVRTEATAAQSLTLLCSPRLARSNFTAPDEIQKYVTDGELYLRIDVYTTTGEFPYAHRYPCTPPTHFPGSPSSSPALTLSFYQLIQRSRAPPDLGGKRCRIRFCAGRLRGAILARFEIMSRRGICNAAIDLDSCPILLGAAADKRTRAHASASRGDLPYAHPFLTRIFIAAYDRTV